MGDIADYHVEMMTSGRWASGYVKAHRDNRPRKVHCDYCGRRAEYIDSALVYGNSYGMIYACLPCNAWVGVHKGTAKPLGRLANEELRSWKKAAHKAFDPIWKQGGMNRGQAYKWLAQQLGLPPQQTYVGMFDVDQCKQVVKICNKERNIDMSNLNDYLNDLEKDYEQASTSNNVPDGRYSVMIKKAEVVENSRKPGFRLSWDLVVMDGPQKGRHIFRGNGLTENAMGFLKQDLARAGVEMERLSDLPGICETQMAGRMLEVSVDSSKNKDYPNVYINKYAGMGDPAILETKSGGASLGTGNDDDYVVIDDGEDLPF